MSVVRYSPWNTGTRTGAVPREFKQIFDRFFAGEGNDQSNMVTSEWQPRVDVREEKDRFIIQADIPGLDPKDIEIHMENGVLTVKGERKAESKEATTQYTRIERAHGLFHRRFALPDSAHADGISASGKNGVLEIVIPKRPETTPRRISVNG
jgi:HSP20 family protein